MNVNNEEHSGNSISIVKIFSEIPILVSPMHTRIGVAVWYFLKLALEISRFSQFPVWCMNEALCIYISVLIDKVSMKDIYVYVFLFFYAHGM